MAIDRHVAPQHTLDVAVLARPGPRGIGAVNAGSRRKRLARGGQPGAPGRERLSAEQRVRHHPRHDLEPRLVGLPDQVPAKTSGGTA